MNRFATHSRTRPSGQQALSWPGLVLLLAALVTLFASAAPSQAQLAPEPWPKAAADNQNTSQSVTLGDIVPAMIGSEGPIHSPNATGPNGNFYYKEYDGSALYLVSAPPNGSDSPNWRINLTAQGDIDPGEEPTSPIVTEQYVYFLAPSENIGTGLFRVDLGGDNLEPVINSQFGMDPEGGVSDVPTIGNNGYMYVPRQGGTVTFVNIQNAIPTIENSVETDGTRVTSPMILEDGRIIVATANGGLFSISPAGDVGDSLIEGVGDFVVAPVLNGGNVVYLVTTGDPEDTNLPTPQIVAVDITLSENNVLWTQQIDSGAPVGIAAGPDGHLYLTTTASTGSTVQRRDASTGAQDWAYNVSGTVSPPSIRNVDPSVQVAHQPPSGEGQVLVYSANSVGTQLPTIPLSGPRSVDLAPTITQNADLAVGTDAGLVLAKSIRPTVSPRSINFSTTLTTDTDPAQADVTIDHPDTGQRLNVTDVRLTGTGASAFTVLNGDDLVSDGIDSNSSATLDLEYRSTVAGTFDATLVISTELFGDYLVTLTGRSIEEGLTGTPNPLVFDTIQLTNTQTKTVDISRTDSDFTIADVRLVDNASGEFGVPNEADIEGSNVDDDTAFPIDVTFSPTVSGLRVATLEVETTDGLMLQVALEGTGIDATLSVTPNPVSFGDVETRTNASQIVTLSNTGEDPLPIPNIFTAAPGTNDYTVSDDNFPSVPAGGSETVTVTFLPPVGGTRTGELVIQTDADLEARVPLTGNGIEPDLTVSPDPLTFGTIDLDDTATASFDITNPKTVDVVVTGISSSNTDFSVTSPTSFTVAGETTETVSVVFDPSVTGLIEGTLTVNTDAGFTRELTVAGEARDVSLTASPTPVEFSGVVRGNTEEIIVTVSNTGTVDLSNISTSITNNEDSEFEIGSANTTLGSTLSAGSSGDIAVQYTPDNEENNTGTLNIQYESIIGDVQTLSISLSGSGINDSLPVTFDTDGPLSFPDTPVGASSTPKALTITNPSSSHYDLKEISLGGTNPGAFIIESFTDQNGNMTTVNGPVFDNGGNVLNIPGGESVQVDIAFTPGQEGGLGASVNIYVNNNLNATTTLSGTGVQPTLTASPDPLDLGNVAAGATVTEQVTLSNPTSVPVTISSAQVTDADNATGFSLANTSMVVSTIAAGGSVTADLTFSSSTSGLDEAMLEVGIDLGGTLQVPLRAQVDAYSLAFTQSNTTFASVPIDSSTTETVTIQNTGTAAFDYAFTGFTGDTGDFAITSGQETGTLAAGDTRSVIVTFTPQAAGTRTVDLAAEASLNGTVVATATATLDGVGLEYNSQITLSSLDFGQVPLGTTSAPDTVIVENSGSAILSILGLSLPSGSPFNIVSGRGSLSLAAGEQLGIVVDFTPQESRFVSASLEIETITGTQTVALNGRGVNNLSASQTLTFPTRLDTEPVDTLQAVFNNVNDIDTDITSVTVSGDVSAFSADIPDPLPTIAPGDSVSIPVAFTATTPGQYAATITVEASTGTTEVTLQGEILPAPRLSPDTLRYGQVLVGSSVTETITITNENALSLTIEESSQIVGGTPGLQIDTALPLTIDSGQSADLSITYAPTDPVGPVTETLRIESTIDLDNEEDGGEEDGDEEGVNVHSVQQDVPITADVVAPPQLVVEPGDDVDFGALVAGQTTATRPFRLINTGGATLTLFSAGLTGTDTPFVLSETPSGTIAPGDTLAFDITAAPTTVGEFTTTFSVESDGGSENRALRVLSIEVDFQVDDAQLNQPTTANVTLPSFAPSAVQRLYVRPGGASTYEALSLQQASEVEWTVDIPARLATLRGFDYFLLIRDGATTITLPGATEAESRAEPTHARVQFDVVSTPRTMPPRGYRMVSVPADIETSDPTEIFGDDYGEFDPRVWRLLRYDPDISDYREAEGLQEVQVGQGLWLATADGQPYDIGPGLSTDASEAKTLELLPGWNQIASPFGFPVAWADVQGTDGLESPVAYRGTDYDYSRPVLQPWSGAWVFNPTDEVRAITIPPVAAGSASSALVAEDAVSPEAGGYTIQLKAQVRSGEQTLRDDANFLGLRKGAAAGLDSLDFAEAPPVGNHVRLSIQDDARRLAGSYLPTGEDGQTWNLELAVSTEKTRAGDPETVRLSLVEHGTAPSGYNLYVFDLDRQMPLPVMAGAVEVPVESGQTAHLRVVAGSETFAKSNSDGIPLEEIETKLGKPYPNPLESEATIEYQLQKTSYVRMELYDILGRRVATLVSEEKTAGQHTLQWSPSGNRRLASGVYFLRMRAGDFTATQKMTIVR
jgi:hypothetical protein